MVDFHTHTRFSDGACTPQELLEEAVHLGITRLAVTDHFDPWDASIQNHPGEEALARHFATLRGLADGLPLRLYCGIETSTDDAGRIRLPAGVTAMCDVVITSVHYVSYGGRVEPGAYFNNGYWDAYRQKLLAQAAGPGHVLGHPEGYLPLRPLLEAGTTFEDRLAICAAISERYFDEAFVEALGLALVKSGKAYELHGASGTPREWVVQKLHGMGVRFSIGSDAHALDLLGCNQRAMHLWRQYNLSVFAPGKSPGQGRCKGDC